MSSSKRRRSKMKHRAKNKNILHQTPSSFWIAGAIMGLGVLFIIFSLRSSDTNAKAVVDPVVIAQGQGIFDTMCAVCHGLNGEGIVGPSLNGSGHGWHHPDPQLRDVIANGRPNTQMVGHGDHLSVEEIDAVIKYFQSWWDPEQLAMQQRGQHTMN